MKRYNFRPNRSKTGDGFFLKLYLGQILHRDDIFSYEPKKTGAARTRQLRGIHAHLQQSIVKVINDRAKGQKRTARIPLTNNAVVQASHDLGIDKRWILSPHLLEILQLQTEFIKDHYLRIGSRLQFRLTAKTLYYFDKQNNNNKTGEAMFLCFRLLKDTPIFRN